jgi:hypothetical protein
MKRTKYNQALKSLGEEQMIKRVGNLKKLLIILIAGLVGASFIVGVFKLGSVAQCYTGERNCDVQYSQ